MANSWMRARLSDHLVRYRHSHGAVLRKQGDRRRANHFTGRPKIVSWRNARGQLRHGQCPLGSKADIATDQPNVRFTPKSGHWLSASGCPLCATRWGNRPAFLWIAERFLGAALQADGETGSPLYGPQASEGEAQHGPFCWTGCLGQGHEHLHCG